MHTYGEPIPGTREDKIAKIDRLPDDLRHAVAALTDSQLDTPYRAGGWTVRQVVHHLADSHINAYTRVRLLLTEDNPTIKPYDQDKWADLPDARTLPVDVSLAILRPLHIRFAAAFRNAPADAWLRTVNHPEQGRLTLEQFLNEYAWHGHHHLEQIEALKRAKGW
jgi:DinB family protein